MAGLRLAVEAPLGPVAPAMHGRATGRTDAEGRYELLDSPGPAHRALRFASVVLSARHEHLKLPVAAPAAILVSRHLARAVVRAPEEGNGLGDVVRLNQGRTGLAARPRLLRTARAAPPRAGVEDRATVSAQACARRKKVPDFRGADRTSPFDSHNRNRARAGSLGGHHAAFGLLGGAGRRQRMG